MKNLFKKFKIRSFRIVLERLILEENDIKQLPEATQNDSTSKIQLKECKVVLSRSETEELIRKFQTVNRKGKYPIISLDFSFQIQCTEYYRLYKQKQCIVMLYFRTSITWTKTTKSKGN